MLSKDGEYDTKHTGSSAEINFHRIKVVSRYRARQLIVLCVCVGGGGGLGGGGYRMNKKMIQHCDTMIDVALTTPKYLCTNHGEQKRFFQFEIIINVLVSFFAFSLPCRAKRQYLLTLHVGRYCLLAYGMSLLPAL